MARHQIDLGSGRPPTETAQPELVTYERVYVVFAEHAPDHLVGRREFVTPEEAGAAVAEVLRAGGLIDKVYRRDREV